MALWCGKPTQNTLPPDTYQGIPVCQQQHRHKPYSAVLSPKHMVKFCAHKAAEALLLDDHVAWRGRQPINQRRSWWLIHWYGSWLPIQNDTNLKQAGLCCVQAANQMLHIPSVPRTQTPPPSLNSDCLVRSTSRPGKGMNAHQSSHIGKEFLAHVHTATERNHGSSALPLHCQTTQQHLRLPNLAPITSSRAPP